MPKTFRVILCVLFVTALLPGVAFAAGRVPSGLKPGADAYRAPRVPGASRSLAADVTTATPDEWEDADDGYAGATTIQNWGTDEFVQDHTLDSASDRDFYVLNCDGETLYEIETITNVDTIIEIRELGTHELLGWFDDKSSSDLGSMAHYEVRNTAGKQVYAIVRAANSINGVGSYRIVVTPYSGYFMPGETSRIDGLTRFAVAANTGKAMYANWKHFDGSPVTDVIVVNGEDRAMADPLAASALAGVYSAPILTVTAAALPADTANAIKAIKTGNGGKVRIHVLGGTSSVSVGVYAKLSALRGSGGAIERISGATRYELAAKIADRVDDLWVKDMGRHAPVVLVANGENPAAFPDALAASAVCARMGWPMVLTQNTKVPTSTSAMLSGVFKDSSTGIVNSSTYVPTGVYNAVKHADSSRLSTHADRYNSAVDIAKWGMERNILSSYEVALVNKLSDALGAGTYAGLWGGVLLYTPLEGPGTAATAFMTKRHSIIRYGTIFGGKASVSSATFNRVETTLNPNP